MAFSAACRKARITGLRLHDFRHIAGTDLRRVGADSVAAMKIVGHESGGMHRRYPSIRPEDLHEDEAKRKRKNLTR